MQLIVENPANGDLSEFCEFLIQETVESVLSKLSAAKLKLFTAYFNKNLEDSGKKVKIDAYELFIDGLNHLMFTDEGTQYSIHIDREPTIENIDLKIVDFMKFINYGNLLIKGYPILSEDFDESRNHLKDLIHKFTSLQGM